MSKTVTLSDEEASIVRSTLRARASAIYQEVTAEEYEDAAYEQQRQDEGDRKMRELRELEDKFR